MSYFVITNGKGKYIQKDEATGKFIPVDSIAQATRWDNIQKANGVLNNSIAKSVKSGFAVQLIDTKCEIETEYSDPCMNLCHRDIIEDEIQLWIHKIFTIMDLVKNSKERRQKLNDKLSHVDKEIVDIEHYIEFGTFNAYQGWQCFKMLQNALLQRRNYKSEICIIDMIEQCKIDEKSLQALSNKIENMNKSYRPRALPELFKTD